MNQYLALLTASITTFAATNVDDAFLLTLFFARRIPARRIVAGQYLGIGAIVLVSLIGVWAALAIPHRWIRLLGLVPLAIGVNHLLRTRGTEREAPHLRGSGVVSIAFVTLSNGADNIGVYAPFFVSNRPHLWLILSLYAAMVAIWCSVGRWLGKHPLVLRSVDRWGRWIVPVVFISLGIYVLDS